MFKQVWKTWDDIIFKPISTHGICLFRIGLGAIVMLAALLRCPDFLMWYGAHGIFPYNDQMNYAHLFTIWQFVQPTDKNIEIVLALYFIAGFLLTIGLFTRFATLASYVCYIAFRTRLPYLWVSIDAAVHIFMPIMLLAPAGETFSVDQWLRKKFNKNYKEKLYSPFAQRLLQLAVANIYIRGFLSKIVSLDWTTGTNGLNYSIHSEWIKYGLPPSLETESFYQLATWATFAVEFSLFTAIWFKKTRYWTLGIGVFFHILLNYSLNIDFLEYGMIASYILFIYPEDLERILQRLRLVPGPAA